MNAYLMLLRYDCHVARQKNYREHMLPIFMCSRLTILRLTRSKKPFLKTM